MLRIEQTEQIKLESLPNEILLRINHSQSAKETARLAHVNRHFHCLFQPEIGKQEAIESAKCAIHPTNENVEALQKQLHNCPPLLLHPVTVMNRHDMKIKGTVYQIALHEADHELIDDLIRPAFERLHNGLAIMEAQRLEWLPEGWTDAEVEICANVSNAIDKLFIEFKNASNPEDVTELPQYPHTITINHQGAKEALTACKKSIAALYHPTANMITSGRDPILRLLERVVNCHDKNYDVFGGYGSPRNNAIMREVLGYCQRFMPINFMQAFAYGIYFIVSDKQKLIRSFEHRDWPGHLILPLDSDPLFRLGYEYFVPSQVKVRNAGLEAGIECRLRNFLSIKNVCISTVIHSATLGKG